MPGKRKSGIPDECDAEASAALLAMNELVNGLSLVIVHIKRSL